MKHKLPIIAIIILMASTSLQSCIWNMGRGDIRDRHIERAVLTYLDTVPGVQYLGQSDTHVLEDGNFQAVIIFNVPDSAGNMVERNARITTDINGREIYTWEDLDCQILNEAKQRFTEELNENGINIDGSLIDALIELKRK